MRARLFAGLLVMFALAVPGFAQDRRGAPSLDRALSHLRQTTPGKFYDADGPYFGSDGRPSYRVKWMTPDGRIVWFNVDAQTGQMQRGAPSGGWSGPSQGRSREPEERAPASNPSNGWAERNRGGWGERNNWQNNGGGWNGPPDGAPGAWEPRGNSGPANQGSWGGRNNSGSRGGWGNTPSPGNQGSWGGRGGNNSGGWGGNAPREPDNARGRDNARSGWDGRSGDMDRRGQDRSDRDRGDRDRGDRGRSGGWDNGGRGGNDRERGRR